MRYGRSAFTKSMAFKPFAPSKRTVFSDGTGPCQNGRLKRRWFSQIRGGGSSMVMLETLKALAEPNRFQIVELSGHGLSGTRSRCPGGSSSILPGCDTEYSLERFAEGGVGTVAHAFCHFEQLLITFLQQSCCLLHSPTCQIFQRCLPNQVLKANRKSGTRHAACRGQRFDCPRILHFLVHGFESNTDLPIENRPQQAALAVFRQRSDVGADRVYEQ